MAFLSVLRIVCNFLCWYWRGLFYDNGETPSLARHAIGFGFAFIAVLLAGYGLLVVFVIVSHRSTEAAPVLAAVGDTIKGVLAGQSFGTIALYIAQKVMGGGTSDSATLDLEVRTDAPSVAVAEGAG